MNKDISKYFNECKYLFCSFGKKEKEYLKKLKDNLIIDNRTLSYEDVVERLGTPKDVIINYYEQEDIYNIIKRAKLRKLLRNLLIGFLIIVFVFLAYRTYVYQMEYNEIKNSNNGYFEEIIE